jgi:hypothetical protein
MGSEALTHHEGESRPCDAIRGLNRLHENAKESTRFFDGHQRPPSTFSIRSYSGKPLKVTVIFSGLSKSGAYIFM